MSPGVICQKTSNVFLLLVLVFHCREKETARRKVTWTIFIYSVQREHVREKSIDAHSSYCWKRLIVRDTSIKWLSCRVSEDSRTMRCCPRLPGDSTILDFFSERWMCSLAFHLCSFPRLLMDEEQKNATCFRHTHIQHTDWHTRVCMYVCMCVCRCVPIVKKTPTLRNAKQEDSSCLARLRLRALSLVWSFNL